MGQNCLALLSFQLFKKESQWERWVWENPVSLTLQCRQSPGDASVVLENNTECSELLFSDFLTIVSNHINTTACVLYLAQGVSIIKNQTACWVFYKWRTSDGFQLLLFSMSFKRKNYDPVVIYEIWESLCSQQIHILPTDINNCSKHTVRCWKSYNLLQFQANQKNIWLN